jgi:hypothetical protein
MFRKLSFWAEEKLEPPEPYESTQSCTVVWAEDQVYMWSDDKDTMYNYVVTMDEPGSTWTVTAPPEWNK